MTEKSAWSAGPPQALFANNSGEQDCMVTGVGTVRTPIRPMTSNNPRMGIPAPMKFTIGKFRFSAPDNSNVQNNTIRPVMTPNSNTPVRPGLEMVQTPRGLMPRIIAEKVFGPGGNQGVALTREQSKNLFVCKQTVFTPTSIPNAKNWNGMNINPAIDQSFRPPTFAQSAQPPVPRKEWPPGLTHYIQRCFAKCKTDQEKDECEQYCKKLINDKIKDNSAWSIDWMNQPLAFDVLYPNNEKALNLKRTNTERIAKKEAAGADFQSPKRQRFSSILHSFQTAVSTPDGGSPFGGPAGPMPDYLSSDKKSSRADRFAKENTTFELSSTKNTMRQQPLKLSFSQTGFGNYKVKGTSTDIFKPYLRLTAAPAPYQVRTFETLKKSLMAVRKKWKESIKDVESYRFCCDQFKSIRQDLTVQEIRNHFTVEVYEIHGRIALDAGDHEEFNQCQSQLNQLMKVHGLESKHRAEFSAYEIVYNMLTKNMTDMSVALQKLDKTLLRDPQIQLVLKLRKAWANDNYYRFFRLYYQSDIGIRALVDKFIDSHRKKSLSVIMRSYKPTVPISLIQQQLGFQLDEEECRDFLKDAGATLKSDSLDIKSGLKTIKKK